MLRRWDKVSNANDDLPAAAATSDNEDTSPTLEIVSFNFIAAFADSFKSVSNCVSGVFN